MPFGFGFKSIYETLTIEQLQKIINKNPLESFFEETQTAFDTLDYKSLAYNGFKQLSIFIYYLSNPSDNLFDIATEVAKGKNPETIKLALKQNETQFYARIGVNTTSTILTALNVVSLSNPITAVVITATNLVINLANFASITAIQRSNDAEHHLDNYRKLVPNYPISNFAKSIFHDEIQKQRQIRPKCRALTKNCEIEHIRYWFIAQMFRNLIDSYKDLKLEFFTNFNEERFLDLINNEKIDLNIALKKYYDIIKEAKLELSKRLDKKPKYEETIIKNDKKIKIETKQKNILELLFNFIDEIFTLIFKKV